MSIHQTTHPKPPGIAVSLHEMAHQSPAYAEIIDKAAK